jgi:hypothetical protein
MRAREGAESRLQVPSQSGSGSTRAPAYVSFAAFSRFIDWFAGLSEFPGELPRTQWPRNLQGGTGLQLAAALRFLGLFDGDAPTEALRSIAVKDSATRRKALATLIRDIYGADFVDNMATASVDEIDSHLQSLGTTDSTHRRAVSFLINAARDAELALPAEVSKRARIRRTNGATRKSAAGRKPRAAAAAIDSATTTPEPGPRRRGRPPGSKNRKASMPTPGPVTAAPVRKEAAPVRSAETVPAESVEELRIKYIETLMARLEASPEALDGKLLDRIERLLGFTPDTD